MTQLEGTEQLTNVNQKVVEQGEVLPMVKLKDGTQVQTGTVATMLYNIQLYNEGARGEVEQELILAIPTLFKVGLFDLFSINEWVQGDNAGRKFVGEHAKQYALKHQ